MFTTAHDVVDDVELDVESLELGLSLPSACNSRDGELEATYWIIRQIVCCKSRQSACL